MIRGDSDSAHSGSVLAHEISDDDGQIRQAARQCAVVLAERLGSCALPVRAAVRRPRRTFLSARPRAHGLLRTRLMLRPVPSYLPALQNAPGAVQTRACCKPESFGKRPSCRCQSGSALLTLIGLYSWNEAPCAKSHLEFDYPSSSLGAPISNPGEPAEPFSGHNCRSCAFLPSQQARAASQPYTHNDPSSAGGSPGYREGPSPLL